MPNNQAIITHSAGIIFADGYDFHHPINFELVIGWEAIEAALKDGVYIIPTGQPVRGVITSQTMNAPLLAMLTGGTLAAGCTRPKEERLTKAGDALTLSQTPANTNAIRIQPVGSSVAPLIQVASGPAVGEYSISGTTVTLNASQTQTQFDCTYLYADAVNGDKLPLDPGDLPSTFELMSAVKAEDVFPGTSGWVVFEAAKVQRNGEIVFRNGKGESNPLEIPINIYRTAPNDFIIHIIAE